MNTIETLAHYVFGYQPHLAPEPLKDYLKSSEEEIKEDPFGFFFVKNLAAQAKLYPGRIQPKYVDEWIKRADGTLVTSQKEAESYCHRRNGQIQEMLLTLAGATVDYSGADLEGIAQQLANQWISAAQRGLNLQDMNSTVLCQ